MFATSHLLASVQSLRFVEILPILQTLCPVTMSTRMLKAIGTLNELDKARLIIVLYDATDVKVTLWHGTPSRGSLIVLVA